MLINEICKKYNLTPRTLRYYEEIDLIKSSRNESNIRIYDRQAIEKIELVLLFKKFGFQLKEIKLLLASDDDDLFRDLLYKELDRLNYEQQELMHKKHMIQSVLKTYGSTDDSKHSLLEFMKEQVYVKDIGEELIMLENIKDIEIVIGSGLIPCAASESEEMLIARVKQLRVGLKKEMNIDMDLVRILDDVDLEETQFYIKQGKKILVDKIIDSNNPLTHTNIVIEQLKKIIINCKNS